MRAFVITLVFAVVAIGGTYLGLFLYRARRQKDNTPALDTVAKMLDGAFRDIDNVTGLLDGRAVTYANRSTRYTAFTELVVSAPGAKVLLEMRAKNLGDAPELVQGAPTVDANSIVRELAGRIAQLHPKSIDIDDKAVRIVMDRTIRDDADARELVKLGADLASRSKATIASDDKAAAERARMRSDQSQRRQQRILLAVIVFTVIGAGTVFGVRAMLARRAAQAEASGR